MKNLCRMFIGFFLIFLFASCALTPGIKEPRYSDEGQIFVYLSSSQEPATDITFVISGMSFMDRDGIWFDIPMKPRTINSIKLSRNQIKLREFYLPEGKYKKIKLIVTEASLKRDKKKHSLALPQAVNNQAIYGELLVDIDFNVFYRESLCLFVDWNINRSIVDKYLFQPGLVAKPQRLEIKNILVYVSNEGSNCVTVIDKQEDLVVGTIAVGEAPRGIAANSDGTRIYVANSRSNSISVIDTSVNRVSTTIDNLGYSPEELALSWDDDTIFVTNPRSNNVSVIDAASNIVVARINVGERPIDIVADTERGGKIYVSNYYSLSISVIDMATRVVENTISLSSNPKYLALCDDRLYVGNESVNDVYVVDIPYIDPDSINTVNIGSSPERLVCGLTNRVYAGNIAFDEISFLHTSLDMITKNIAVGRSPAGMDVDAMRRKLYVSNKSSEDVSVIDIKTERVVKTVQVGKKPHDIVLVAE